MNSIRDMIPSKKVKKITVQTYTSKTNISVHTKTSLLESFMYCNDTYSPFPYLVSGRSHISKETYNTH